MPPLLFLSLRFFALNRPGLARFTAIAACLSIAAGAAAFIFARAIARGFESELRSRLLANTAHITITQKDGAGIRDWIAARDRLTDIPDLERIVAEARLGGMLIGRESSSLVFIHSSMSYASWPGGASDMDQGISLGNELAHLAGVTPGGEAELIVPDPQGMLRKTRIRIDRTFSTGLYDYDVSLVRASPTEFAAITGNENFTPSVLNVFVKDIYRTGEAAEMIRGRLAETFVVRDWREMNRPLFDALKIEQRAMLAVVVLVALIASLNIAASAALVAREHTADIAVLRTNGLKTFGTAAIFILQALLLSALGTGIGLAAGYGACILANETGMLSLSPEVYSITRFTAKPVWEDAAIAAIGVLVLTFLAVLYPSAKAAGTKPLEVFRQQ